MSNLANGALRIVAFQADGAWIAQCVEHDISVQAVDLPTLQRRMNAVIKEEARVTLELHGEAFASLDPAPHYFEAMWDEGIEASLHEKVEFRIAA